MNTIMRALPDHITDLTLKTGLVHLDEAGFLTDPADWSVEFARYSAAQEDLTLSELHWQVVRFMRAYLGDHGIAADARFAIKFLAAELGTDKKGARAELFRLFPYGYVKQACKIAGMRQPRAWSTG